MLIFNTTKDLLQFREEQKNIQIGFVPTMGALHQGHLELIQLSKQQNDFTYVSIFVNPLQFNNKEDLEKYPRNLEKDIELLQSIDADALFAPTFNEVYHTGFTSDEIDLDFLNSILEGPKRPGHFEGVVKVVSILFKIIQPHKAYFGLKDFQQIKVIQEFVNQKKYPVQIVECPIVREKNGLAMSSRNIRLSENGREKAAQIYRWLMQAKQLYHQGKNIKDIEQIIIDDIKNNMDFQLDYFEIRNAHDLSLPKTNLSSRLIALIAVYLENVRLIDNIYLN